MEPKDLSRVTALELAIGARMRTRRRQLGLSQSELAEKLGVSFQQVQKYERGANRVAASTLVTASIALGTTVAWLVGEEASGRDDDEDVFRALAAPAPWRSCRPSTRSPTYPPAWRSFPSSGRWPPRRWIRPRVELDRSLSRRGLSEFGCVVLFAPSRCASRAVRTSALSSSPR